jgi:hypothetical protein
VFWFATYYSLLTAAHLIVVACAPFPSILRESLMLMVANSTSGVEFVHGLPITISTLQSVIGLFMVIVVLAHFVTLLPPPGTRRPERSQPGGQS